MRSIDDIEAVLKGKSSMGKRGNVAGSSKEKKAEDGDEPKAKKGRKSLNKSQDKKDKEKAELPASPTANVQDSQIPASQPRTLRRHSSDGGQDQFN